MCRPEYYGIEYEINPWMDRRRGILVGEARRQWEHLYECLLRVGAAVHLLQPAPGLPDLVFTANSGMVWHDKVFLTRFRYSQRQPETTIADDWFREHRFEVIEIPAGWHFEGAGDALFCGNTLFGGYRIRSDIQALQWIAKQCGVRVIPLELVDAYYYHLDTCFCPLSPTEALYYPAAFDRYAQTALRTHIPNLIAVSADEAVRFACNAVVVGRDVILNTGCLRLERQLTNLGYRTHAIQLDEFLKAGGSAKCLTLRLDGEDAASWKQVETHAALHSSFSNNSRTAVVESLASARPASSSS